VILLPGLYLALLAFLLDRALRRWWDPVPARVWGAFGLVLVILFGPALFLGKVLLPADILPGVAQPEEARKPPQGNVLQNDLVTQVVPLQSQVRREVRTGAWPLWNDLAGAGMPLLADFSAETFEPLVLAAFPLSLPSAVGVTAGLRVLLALVFLFLLLRRQGLSEGASLFGSLAFGLGGFLLLWLNWPLANSPALLPLVLYALTVTEQRGARRDLLLLVAAVFSLLVGGHPETIVYMTVLAGLFALSRLRRHPAGDRTRLLVRWAAAGVLAAGLAAPLQVPAFRFVPQSLRHQWVEARNERLGANPETGIHESSQGVRQRVVLVFAPNAFGNSRYGEYWGVTNNNEDSSAFVGGAAMLAALLAFFPVSRRFPEERIFLVLAPVSLLIAVHLPGVRLLSSKLPVLNQSLSANRRLLLVVAFSLAYLGACTVERWRTGAGPRRWAVLATAAVLLGLIAWGYLLSADVKALAVLRWLWMGTQLAAVAGAALVLSRTLTPGPSPVPSHPPSPGEGRKTVSSRFWFSPSSPGEGGWEGTGEEGRGGEGRAGRRSAVLVLCALVAAELLIFHRPANPSLPRSAYYPVTPLIRFLQENADGTRIAPLETRILPNAAAVYGLADVRISNPLKPFLYAQALGPVSAAVRSTEHVLTAPDHPLYQFLGVRFVVAPPRMHSIPGLRQVFHDPTGRVFERERVLPRLFLPASTETAGALPWPEWLATNPDFAARALVPPVPGRPVTWTAGRPRDSALQIVALTPARVIARARLAEQRLLASSIYQDGGWRLLLDGRPFPTEVADGPFVSAWLPAGDHRVELLYRAPGFLTGLALAAAALAGVVGWLLPTARR